MMDGAQKQQSEARDKHKVDVYEGNLDLAPRMVDNVSIFVSNQKDWVVLVGRAPVLPFEDKTVTFVGQWAVSWNRFERLYLQMRRVIKSEGGSLAELDKKADEQLTASNASTESTNG